MTVAPKTSPEDTSTSETELDATSLSAIRSILTEEVEQAPGQKLERSRRYPVEIVPNEMPVRRKADTLPPLRSAHLDDVAFEGSAAGTKKSKRRFSLRRKIAKPVVNTQKPKSEVTQGHKLVQQLASIVERIRVYRPKRLHVALAVFGLIVLLRPWLVFGFFAVVVFIMVGAFLVVGYDGFWKGVMKAGRWYADRRPSGAALLNARLDRFAMRWDAILDRFPEGTVDGLYLPDFAELSTADARHDEALERRLSGLSETEA